MIAEANAGIGKTHLAISLSITATESGRKIYFGTLSDLVNSRRRRRLPAGSSAASRR